MSLFLIYGRKITDVRSLKKVHYKVHTDVEGNQSREIEMMLWRLHNTGFIPGNTEFILVNKGIKIPKLQKIKCVLKW